ncbi:MAG: class I SAM-dependent methyltransferase, partial [Anaerolineae bacterium]
MMNESTIDSARVTEQYRTSANLGKRISLHERFSTNSQSWHRWIFEHLDLPDECRILELGGGPGKLWSENLDRIPTEWQITVTDFSAGMVAEAVKNLASHPRPFTFKIVDAQRVPFDDATFDAVMANHMLYHVPDREQALSEMRRVLKPGGHFYASTVGETHMQELWDMAESLVPGVNAQVRANTLGFNLENGREILAPWFSEIKVHLFDDALVVTEAEPLIAYVLSSTTLTGELIPKAQREAFANLVERRIA